MENQYRALAMQYKAQYGELMTVKYLSHFPEFQIQFIFQNGVVYSGRRTGSYDINFLSLGYVGEGPRYAQAFLDQLGFPMSTWEIAEIKPGAVIRSDAGHVRVSYPYANSSTPADHSHLLDTFMLFATAIGILVAIGALIVFLDG